MKHTLWDQKYSGREEISQEALVRLFDPSGSLDGQELIGVLALVAKTSEIPIQKLRPADRFDEIFVPMPTRSLRHLLVGIHTALKVWDLDTDLEDALRKRCKTNNLPIPQTLIMTLEEYVAVWFGAQSKAA
ncbi:MAG TPA: hypothetical protein VGV16_00955 [Gammaproteobacteria bacterium]|nr:hypothetical protein [Gammaproteobacteria bacterium]